MNKYLKFRILIMLGLSLLAVGPVFSQSGVVKGRVYDALSNESLPFVNVVVAGTTTGAVTDDNGEFQIGSLEPGFVRLEVSFVGYKQAVSGEIMISNAKQAYVELALEETDTKLDEVVVTASKFQKVQESPVSLRSIGLSEIENNPGANRDISKVIQSFPGVGFSVSFRNDIIIRGGGPSESRFYLDGVEIPNLNHFATQGASGGPVGIINADFISAVNYYSGAFPSNRGNALSGVFDFTQVDGNKNKARFRGTVGASELSLTADGPLGEKTTYIVSARQSYLQFLFSALGLPFLPTYNDFQFKTRTRIDAKNEIIVTGIGAIDHNRLNLDIEDPEEDQAYILSYLPENDQWSYAGGAVWKHFREKSYQTVVLSRNHLSNASYKYPGNNKSLPRSYDYDSDEIETKLRVETTNRMNGFKLNAGINAEQAEYTNNTYRLRFSSGTLDTINYEADLRMLKWGTFGQLSRAFFNDRLNLSAGFRMDANNYAASMSNMFSQFSPRFSASYGLTEKLFINANTGRYYQLPAYTTLGYTQNSELVNKANGIKYIQADHYIAGLELLPNSMAKFSLEGFYKKYANYPFSVLDSICLANSGADFGVVGDEEVKSLSEGRAFGFEFLGRYEKLGNYNIVLSYTFVKSEFRSPTQAYRPSSWDSRHIVVLTGFKKFKKNWSLGLKWRFSGGLPYTPYDMVNSRKKEIFDANGSLLIDYGQLNAERLGVFHRLDIRVDKGFYFDRFSFKAYLDIQNLYNFQTKQQDLVLRQADDNGNYLLNNDGTEYLFRNIPNVSGTVLPTIGLMFEF